MLPSSWSKKKSRMKSARSKQQALFDPENGGNTFLLNVSVYRSTRRYIPDERCEGLVQGISPRVFADHSTTSITPASQFDIFVTHAEVR
jgi:hypothetical protein